jgi:TRAP-type C4-dicarboxylate transport system permease small subunit
MSLDSFEKKMLTISRYTSLPSVIVLFLMMLLTTTDVFGRYVLGKPIPGSIDFITVMMVILVFPALAYVTAQDGHVRTDVLFDRLSARGKGYFDIVNALCTMCFAFLMTYQLGMRCVLIIKNPPGIATGYFQWPHFPFICLAALGCALMDIELVIWFISSVQRAAGKVNK